MQQKDLLVVIEEAIRSVIEETGGLGPSTAMKVLEKAALAAEILESVRKGRLGQPLINPTISTGTGVLGGYPGLLRNVVLGG